MYQMVISSVYRSVSGGQALVALRPRVACAELLRAPRRRPDADAAAVLAHDRCMSRERDEAAQVGFAGPDRQAAAALARGLDVQEHADRARQRPPAASERDAVAGDPGQVATASRSDAAGGRCR